MVYNIFKTQISFYTILFQCCTKDEDGANKGIIDFEVDTKPGTVAFFWADYVDSSDLQSHSQQTTRMKKQDLCIRN